MTFLKTVLREDSAKDTLERFGADVRAGLTRSDKQVSSRYFYDEVGGEIFHQITQLPEYYLSRAEWQVLAEHADEIFTFPGEDFFNLIELGSGCSDKTRLMLENMSMRKRPFVFMPIDTDQSVINRLGECVQSEWVLSTPIPFHALIGEYMMGLNWIKENNPYAPKFIVFLGSNLGNFTHEDAVQFLKQIRQTLMFGDQLLIGFDRKKNVRMIHRAYDDPRGVTRQFNMNLLTRMNRELGANFDHGLFTHYPYYDFDIGGMVSHLVSNKQQTVTLKKLNLNVKFAAGEPIRTEYSRKFSISDIEWLAELSGFKVVKHYSHQDELFTDSLWTVA